MNTSEFSRFKEDPDPQFADELYSRIAGRKSMIARLNPATMKPAALLRAGLLLVFAIGIVAACARQLFEPRNVRIGSLWVYETSESAYCVPVDDVFPVYTPSGPMPTPQNPPLSTPATIGLHELSENLDFKLEIPVWAPDGFELVRKVHAGALRQPFFFIGWRGSGNLSINMMVSATNRYPSGRAVRAVYNSWEEVSVQGDPAVIVRPSCDDLSWPEVLQGDRLSLHWSRNGGEYILYSDDIDREALLRMAESAR